MKLCTSTTTNPNFEIVDEEHDDGVEEEVNDYGRKNFVELVGPYLKPYIYNRRFIDKMYDIRREDDGRIINGDSTLSFDNTSDISIKRSHFKDTRGLWELLTP